MANCKFCGKEINWMRDGRKSVPIELDGLPHECEEAKNARKAKRIEVGSLSPEEIAKYEQAINEKSKK